MPSFNLKCQECGLEQKRLCKSPKEIPHIECKQCRAKGMERMAGETSSQVIEVLDNGLMPRRLERHKDAERMYRERARNADVLAGQGRRNYD